MYLMLLLRNIKSMNILHPLCVKNVLQGYNGCIIAYGQKGSGKRFSMFGNPKIKKMRGIVHRAIEQIFFKLD